MSFVSRLSTATGTAVLVGAALIASSGSAAASTPTPNVVSASPSALSGCFGQLISYSAGRSRCNSGGTSGEQRVIVRCFGSHGLYNAVGKWTVANQYSVAACVSGDEAYLADYETSS